MALLGSKASYLGVDIGTSSVKVVEFRNEGGRPKLVTYAFIERPTNVVKLDSAQEQGLVATALRDLIKRSRATSDRVVAALPSFAVFSSIVSLPVMPRKDLYAAVRWEAKKFVPMPIEEMVLDWRLLKDKDRETPPAPSSQLAEHPAAERGPKNLRVLLTAAPKTLVKRYIDIFKGANLRLVSLETESFALERSLLGGEPGSFMIVDIGAVATTITITVNSIPLLNRSIDVGGDTITKAIANSLNVDQQRAEQFKRDVGIGGEQIQGGQIPRAIEFVVSSIVNEIRYVFNLYHNQGEKPIEKIILSGGSAFLTNLPEYLATTLNMKVFIGDPWARVIYPVDLKPALDEIGPRFTVAIGLAMREIITP
ncbi:MAG: type IV pilus assembly protein PilM [Candidatus Kerfeldbacteria bacterium]|nr:type IV pilus assembly protein PilM [Candidatus Kerfeldbacteria bacterium]